MNRERFLRFCAAVRAIPHAPCWHTHIQLHAGRRRRGLHKLESSESI
jgi:hypothetical protein